MKRVGFSAVLLSLALSAPASGQWVSDPEYKYFYEGCGLYSCHWLSLTEPDPTSQWAWVSHTWNVFAGWPEFEGDPEWPGLGAMPFMGLFPGFGSFWQDFYMYTAAGTHTSAVEMFFDPPWPIPLQGFVGVVYGPNNCFWEEGFCDDEGLEPHPWGEELAEDWIEVNLARVAVPTPATWLLLASGVGGVAAVARRRRPA
jgi:hypothetical protein